MVGKKKKVQEVETVAEPVVIEEQSSLDNLKKALGEIKTYSGVIGYILRNSTSATIDLKDPTKIIDYALLSSSTLDAGDELSSLFSLGEVKEVVLEGMDVKAVSLILDENRISVFLEKDADIEKILKKLRSP